LIKTAGVDEVGQVEIKPEGIRIFQYVFLLSLVLVLPGVQWPLLSWLNGFVPLFAFLYLYRFGWNRGNKILLQGVILACLVGFFLRSMPLILLSLTSLPAGYVIAHSAARSEKQMITGIKGIVCLGPCWLVFWGGLVATNNAFSYSALIHSIQEGMDASLNIYRQNTSIPVDKLLLIDQFINQAKAVFPVILPAILGNIIIMTIWLTMVLGNRLALRYCNKSPWPEYKYWKLPERLIWAAIVSAVLALIPLQPIQPVGINLLLLAGVLYIFQGLAILVYFFDKWNMPIIFRLPLYTIAVIQSSGTFLLLIVGIADIWFDFRRLADKNFKKDSSPIIM
jgi:uncharacterized protein YybS (DUF2232 family)